MIPPYFNLFKTNNPDEPPLTFVNPSSAVNWSLIKSIDPSLIDFEDEDVLEFIKEFPTYKLSSNDSSILSHPFSIRLFLIMQRCFSAIVQKVKYYIKKTKKQENEIKLMNKKNKEYQKILEADQNDEKKNKPEKCYACGKRFLTVKDVHLHIAKVHPYLIKPWKRIIQNKIDDKNEIIINNLRIDVNNLRQYIYDQDERYKQIVSNIYGKYQAVKKKNKQLRAMQNPQVTVTDLNSKYVSTLEVQPKHSPYVQPTYPSYKINLGNFHSNEDDEDDDEDIYIANEYVREAINSQANIVLKKKERKFDRIRDSIRIHLENKIPMPVSINELPTKLSNSDIVDDTQNLNGVGDLSSEKVESGNIQDISHVSNNDKEIGNSRFNQTDKYQSTKSGFDPFMLSATQTKTSNRFNDYESTATNQNPFIMTDTDVSNRNHQKSSSVKNMVESVDQSSPSRKRNNNTMLVTDDENSYSF